VDDFELSSNDLIDFFSTVSTGKKIIKEQKESLVGGSFDSLFWSQLKENLPQKKVIKKIKKSNKDIQLKEEVIVEKEKVDYIEPNYVEPPSSKNKDPLTPLDQKFLTIEDFNRHYKLFLNRIQQQLSTLGGGGETRLEFLDDINRISVKRHNKYLKYDEPSGKWIGDNPFATYATTLVTNSTYSIQVDDDYIGVNYAGPVTIFLPSNVSNGRMFRIKDERGEASKGTNRYITVMPSGVDLIDGRDRAILAYDYGSLTFIYRDGWRIV
jgi:hypothetical protein